jgi:transposase
MEPSDCDFGAAVVCDVDRLAGPVVVVALPWRDVPERFGPWNSVHKRFDRWSKDGTWDRLLAAVQSR